MQHLILRKKKNSNKKIKFYDSSNKLGYRTLIVLSCGQDTYSAFDVAHVNFDSLNASWGAVKQSTY